VDVVALAPSVHPVEGKGGRCNELLGGEERYRAAASDVNDGSMISPLV
jgi:hypothetical protein